MNRSQQGRKNGQKRWGCESVNDPSQPTQSSQMIHRPLYPTNDPPCLPPFWMSPFAQISTRLLRVCVGQSLWKKSLNDAASCFPTGASGVSTPIPWHDRPSMTVSREFDGFPPSKSLPYPFLKITSLILSADDAIKPPTFPHAINADFLFAKPSPPPNAFPPARPKPANRRCE